MKYIIVYLILGAFASCSNETINNKTETSDTSGTENTSPPPKEEKPDADVNGCYMKIIGRDTAILMIDQKGTDITGRMLYDNFEKDGSRGTVKGKEEAQIIKLWYGFQSEGMHSVMEVYFKKENGKLLRGIGTMDVKGDTTYFTSGVNYSEKEAFNKVDCDVVKGKFE